VHLPVRKTLRHAVPQWVPTESPFFITINCEPRNHNQLCRPGTGNKVLHAANHYHVTGVWNCRLLLLMPDHLHAIIHFSATPGLKTSISNWKKFLARTAAINWQTNFIDHRLRDHHQLVEKIDYILLNPIRNNLCHRIEDWPWIFRGPPR
jgi:REP element-mobilizing transposase RayT